MATLKDLYNQSIKAKLSEEFATANAMQIAKLEKIVISVGCGEGSKDTKLLQNIADTISLIAGQKAVITKAKKSVSGFKIREGMNVGVKVTLRGANMYNFLEKLISLSLPKVKDFKGVSRTGFDGRGNYNLGVLEQIIFPEIDIDKVNKISGMDITFVTSAKTDKEAKSLLTELGLPFKKN